MSDEPLPDCRDAIVRVHGRLDDIWGKLTELAKFAERCGVCTTKIERQEETIFGNGKQGLVARITAIEQVAAAEDRHADRISVKAMITLIAAVGGLAGAIGAALAAVLAKG